MAQIYFFNKTIPYSNSPRAIYSPA